MGQKIYCPFKDCSTALVIDIGQEDQVNVRGTECPVCHRWFCAGCQVPWHSGVECEEFQRLNENERGRDSLMMKELAKEKQWQRCPTVPSAKFMWRRLKVACTLLAGANSTSS